MKPFSNNIQYTIPVKLRTFDVQDKTEVNIDFENLSLTYKNDNGDIDYFHLYDIPLYLIVNIAFEMVKSEYAVYISDECISLVNKNINNIPMQAKIIMEPDFKANIVQAYLAGSILHSEIPDIVDVLTKMILFDNANTVYKDVFDRMKDNE